MLIPLLVYLIWLNVTGRKAVKAGLPRPEFRDGPLYWILIATLMMALLCFLVLGVSIDGEKGSYIPPHVENGVMVPGKVEEKP